MASLLAWRDSWFLGIEHLDRDHRELVRLLNRLIEVGQRPPLYRHQPPQDGGDDARARLQSLIDHLRRHFATEEAFLQSIDYPEISEHKSEHALLLAELVDLHRDLRASGAERIDEESLEQVRDWFLHHVVAEDRRFAWYYYRQMGASGRVARHDNRGQAHHNPATPSPPAHGFGVNPADSRPRW